MEPKDFIIIGLSAFSALLVVTNKNLRKQMKEADEALEEAAQLLEEAAQIMTDDVFEDMVEHFDE